MIPISINLYHNQFTYVIIGEGLLELIFEEVKQGLRETGGIYVGSGTMKLILPCVRNDIPIQHEQPDKWVDVIMLHEVACSFIEWARHQKARAIYDQAPNKSVALTEAFGKRIIIPSELENAWETRKR